MNRFGFVTTLFLAFASALCAAPQQMHYQGFLAYPDGSPLDTSVTMAFTLYNAPHIGASPLWIESHPAVMVQGGLFNVSLGTIQVLPDSLLDTDSLWIGVTIGGNSEMTPRSRVASVAYSRRVGTVDGASGGHINGSVSIGNSTMANGIGSFATGTSSVVQGDVSSAAAGAGHLVDGSFCLVGSGSSNYIENDTDLSVILGGYSNRIGDDDYGLIGNGQNNVVTGRFGTVLNGGGFNYWNGNSVTGDYSVCLGGSNCHVSGNYSVAYGLNGGASGDGIFAFADATGDTFAPGISNTFNVRSSGGVRLYTSANLSSGSRLAAGGSSWIVISDSTKKRNIRPVNTGSILAKVSALPIKQWSYTSQDASIEHIGPMAQDFWKLFQLGDDSLGISTVDPDGIALAAIQELAKQNAEMRSEIAVLRAQVQSMAASNQQSESIIRR